jgi:tetratricopeptide (TPR) repeat protein
MRAYVLTDKALERYAGRFVWLAIDTENAKNAAFLKQFPIPVLPTLLVIDPKKEAVALRYPGGATVPQLKKLLDEGERAVKGKGNSADEALARADRLASSGKTKEAAAAYDEAIKAAPKGWSQLGRAAESLVLALTMSDQGEDCATRAAALYPQVRGTISGVNVAAVGVGCASELPPENANRKALLTTLEKATREAFDDKKIVMSGDDRSGLYQSLIDARNAAGDKESAQKLTEEWSAFLDAEAAKAKTAEQRAAYDPHRLGAYMALKHPEKAVPMLQQTERDLPDDYNAPARLASAYKAMGKFDDALSANERALAKAYGPRKIGIYRTRADIYTAKGDAAAAKETINEAIRYAESLPEGQKSDRTIAALKKKLETM